MIGIMAIGLVSSMIAGVNNATKADSNRKCNIQSANELAGEYKKINDQFEADIKKETDLKKIVDNLNKIEGDKVKDLTNKLNNSQKDYQKKITNIYIIFGVFALIIIIICIIKAVLTFKFKDEMGKKYLNSLNKPQQTSKPKINNK